VRSLAEFKAPGCLVGSGRGLQTHARQVFDESPSARARAREAERKDTKGGVVLGKDQG
jgi:hypothetical protein